MTACRNCFFQLPPGVMLCSLCGGITPNDPELGGTQEIKEDMLVPLAEGEYSEPKRLDLGESAFNEAWGGGMVAGSVTLCGGHAGLGKSTICLQICNHLTQNSDKFAIYIDAEQGKDQLKITAKRLGILDNPKIITLKKMGGGVLTDGVLKKYPPAIIVLDSLSAASDKDLRASVGIAKEYKKLAIKYNAPVIIIGHMNKQSLFAGLQTVQHDVDTLIVLEYDRRDREVIIAVKNRFGPTGKDILIEMTAKGVVSVKTPKKQMALEEAMANAWHDALMARMETMQLDGGMEKLADTYLKGLVRKAIKARTSEEDLLEEADAMLDYRQTPRGKHADRGDKPKSKRRQKKTT